MSDNPLARRGIWSAAVEAGWREMNDGWHYPVFDIHGRKIGKEIGRRWKARDAAHFRNGAKYLWLNGKLDHPMADWYVLPTFEARDGTAYLANGEPALLAFVSAGINHVICTTLSEISVPPNVVQLCEQLEIKKLIYIPDKDQAGIQSAIKWRDALANTNVELRLYQWPDYLPEKGDANDLWIHLKFYAKSFNHVICHLEPLILPKPRKTPNPGDYGATEDTPIGIVDAIAQHYGLKGVRINPSGFYSEPVRCPIHEDNHASAGVHAETGILNCFVCGSVGHREHAEILGIDWKQYLSQKDQRQRSKHPKHQQRRRITVIERAQYEDEIEDVIQSLREFITIDNNRMNYTPEHYAIRLLVRLNLLNMALTSGLDVTNDEYQWINKANEYLDT